MNGVATGIMMDGISTFGFAPLFKKSNLEPEESNSENMLEAEQPINVIII